MARCKSTLSINDSNAYQVEAHKKNRHLFKPSTGMVFTQLIIKQDRIEKIKKWINEKTDFTELNLKLESVLANLSFGVKSDVFENGLEELGKILGFESERPEKSWKNGPDNLWCISNGKYILFECKIEVHEGRLENYKKETGQMGNSCDWFDKKYPKSTITPVIIINTVKLASDASLDPRVKIMRKYMLISLKKNVKAFFMEFSMYDLTSITSEQINKLLSVHKLSEDNFLDFLYFELPIDSKDRNFVVK